MTRRVQATAERRRRRGVAALTAIALAAALGGGCASIRDHRGYVADRTLVRSVQPGVDNRTSVERALGRPTFASEFGQKDWYYVSVSTRQRPFARPRTTDETVTRVRFDDAGDVAAIDQFGREHVVNLSPNGDRTPTLGRNRSFFEDLFGNIGAVGAGGTGPGGDSAPGPNGS